MQMVSNKIYIDYLDHNMGFHALTIDPTIRLRFDLLLFSQDTLCMSVPACIKLESTSRLLMYLTPFWKREKIKLILDRKHKSNPWNYFNNRNKVLEKGFPEESLIHHFEYSAYHSPHTKFFYDVYIKEMIKNRSSLFIDKIFDTDEMFRRSVISQASDICDKICPILPVNQAIHMGKIANELIIIAEDRNTLFQRSAVETALTEVYKANTQEIAIIRRVLDKGFAYANGISSYAVPISQIKNRLTGATLIPMLINSDKEMYNMICNIGWNELYKLSTEDLWLDFIDHLNRLLLLYRDSKRNHQSLFSPVTLEYSLITTELVTKLYETAMESIQQEFIKNGISLPDVLMVKDYSESILDDYLRNKHEYWAVIKEINELLPAIKTYIRSLSRKYKKDSVKLEQQGYIITLDYE